MIAFTTETVRKEWNKASVALRLIAEQLDQESGGATWVFRVMAPTKFENGVHAVGRAMDIELRGASSERVMQACNRVNERFKAPVLNGPVAVMKVNRANFPSGARVDRPHVHLQIPFDWVANPRAFLRAHGYTEGEDQSR